MSIERVVATPNGIHFMHRDASDFTSGVYLTHGDLLQLVAAVEVETRQEYSPAALHCIEREAKLDAGLQQAMTLGHPFAFDPQYDG